MSGDSHKVGFSVDWPAPALEVGYGRGERFVGFLTNPKFNVCGAGSVDIEGVLSDKLLILLD